MTEGREASRGRWTSLRWLRPTPATSAARPFPLHFIWSSAALWSDDVDEILSWLDLVEDPAPRPGRAPVGRTGDPASVYPDFYALGTGSTELLDRLVRTLRPTVVLETGVADGRSSETILRALTANGHGRLHSVDVSPDVGSLVTDRGRWDLHVTDGSPDALASIAHRIGPIDLFIHDSDHSPRAQRAEYEVAWQNLSREGVLCSDDVDWSPAFTEFCKDRHLPFAVLPEVIPYPKIFGVTRPASPPTDDAP